MITGLKERLRNLRARWSASRDRKREREAQGAYARHGSDPNPDVSRRHGERFEDDVSRRH